MGYQRRWRRRVHTTVGELSASDREWVADQEGEEALLSDQTPVWCVHCGVSGVLGDVRVQWGVGRLGSDEEERGPAWVSCFDAECDGAGLGVDLWVGQEMSAEELSPSA